MSGWTHAICEHCWLEREGGRGPARITEEYRDIEQCCFCGSETFSGIYVRKDPSVPQHCKHSEGM